MKRTAALLLFAGAVAMTTVPAALVLGPARAQVAIWGHPRVIDGDTIIVGGIHVRIFGIDAPESEQQCTDQWGAPYACGAIATQYMQDLIGSQAVLCEPRDTDRYGRVVAICYAGHVDVGEAMVRAGWAVDYARYSRGRYTLVQVEAQAEKHGMWIGTFQEPEQWRRAHPWRKD